MRITEITELLQRQMGLAHDTIGESSVVVAVKARLHSLGLTDIDSYLPRLEHPHELQQLIEEIVVPETWFFRGYDQLKFLPDVTTRWRQGATAAPLRVLSVPCSTGEEPYSIYMFLRHYGLESQQLKITAADISGRLLVKAQRGVYSDLSFRETGPLCEVLRLRHFTTSDGRHQLAADVRDAVQFQQDNLVAPGFLAGVPPFDIIFCRNVLIYFDSVARRNALKSLERLLTPNGILFAGHAEPLANIDSRFRSFGPASAFAFQRGDAVTPSAKPPTPIAPATFAPSGFSKPAATPNPRTVPPPKIRMPVADAPAASSCSVATATDLLATAEACANSGRLGEACSLCEQHLQQHGPTAAAYCLMGVIRQVANELLEAEKCFQRALYLDPAHHDSLLHLSLLADRRGDRAAAEIFRRRLARASATGD